MDRTSKILKEELLRERKNLLTENISSLQSSRNKKELMENSVSMISRLLDEGYTGEEIAAEIEEQDGFFSNIFGMAKGGFKGGIWSQVKEMAFRWLLKALGVQSPAKEMLSAALADLSFGKIIGIFKSDQGCVDGIGSIVDILMEQVVLQIQTKMGLGNVISDTVRNVLMDAVRDSNLGEKVATMVVCPRIHNMTNPLNKNSQTSQTNTATA